MNPQGLGAWVSIHYGKGKNQVWEHNIYRGYLSSQQPIAHFGLGTYSTADSVVVTWPDGNKSKIEKVKAGQVLTIASETASTNPFIQLAFLFSLNPNSFTLFFYASKGTF